MQKYEFIEKLGVGAFGDVIKARNVEMGEFVRPTYLAEARRRPRHHGSGSRAPRGSLRSRRSDSASPSGKTASGCAKSRWEPAMQARQHSNPP